ncbi:5'/3'-nucleotidase SurE [Pseudomonas sp. A2]|uniref:5'/3'-nucleotidase SurE n=1 Tax=Pseudomonas sp. A2 TaxID=107445 RepID=UPI002BDFB87A|nr:5'/3'-nucleotidase SurE [Pseudomonas sp. A2]MEB3438074.1 5'/3'-nucleotidase SurE [Pseudomonas sp. A2]
MLQRGHKFERVLVTNDDGIDAPGLRVLEEVAAQIANEVWVVAPLKDQSGTSHSLSLHAPLRISEHGERRFAVTGTPGDCVVMAVQHLLKAKPDLVLSGINRGANLGLETVFSGTVGAAMTGMLLGIRSIGLSQDYTDRSNVPWGNALAHGAKVIQDLLDMDWPVDVCLNVNFPSCPEASILSLKVTRQGAGPLSSMSVRTEVDPRGFEYHWIKLNNERGVDDPGSEMAELMAGHITVTPLQFERTHVAAYNDVIAR